jgi:16S rRNA (cytosine967-C5)-methyltransferase
MLDSVLRGGRTLEAAAQASKGLSPQDQSLAHAIAGEVLRRIPALDALIDSATQRPLPDDSKARMVLRLALAQKIGMRVPEHALVATALPLVDGGPRRLVHGVLGTLLRRQPGEEAEAPLPAEVESRWRTAWGGDAVEAARRQIVARPPLDLSFADDSAAQAFAAAERGISLATRHVRLTDSRPVTELPGFGEGAWWVQDLAASVPARLVPQAAGDVLDLCAAPGGKTMQLAAAGHRPTSLDSSKSRLARLEQNLHRTRLEAKLVNGDALVWEPPGQFGVILLDAPCSATGTFRRHPEVLYRAGARIIAGSIELQAALLQRAARWLKPGGALVYSVCSLEPQEGEDQLRSFLDSHPDFSIEAPLPGELPSGLEPSAEGWVRILPGHLEERGGLDGFFVARLVRSGD